MIKIAQNQQIILNIFLKNENLASSEIHDELSKLGNDVSLITVKRELGELKNLGLLKILGAGRSVKYSVSSYGRLFVDINAKEYSTIDPDKRYGLKSFNFELFNSISNELFSDSEIQELDEVTEVYKKNIHLISKTLEEKELERFIIELSWKSSKIEGNTYTLLDTEKLISRGIEAVGHDINEAKMILNHKEAFKFIRENFNLFKELNLANLEKVHKILIKDFNINYGLREKAVGVTGSSYRPLDNIHQIKEATISLCDVVNMITSPYVKAMIALLGISYIQPFEDGNKRTSRLIANAILLAYEYAPLSYRSVDENSYREAILAFYELNSIIPFKKIFIEQYIFSAKTYSVSGETKK
ncbi:MAG: Fic family protein [Patescibacteria group bacterium]